jgi:hypothetical protein
MILPAIRQGEKPMRSVLAALAAAWFIDNALFFSPTD